MSRFLVQSLFLIASTFFVFIWASTPFLARFTLQLVALLLVIFILNRFLFKKNLVKEKAVEIGILTIIVLLLVYSTGGLTSPLFFLTYFLLFGLSLLLEPAVTLALTLSVVIIFLLSPTQEKILDEILQLFSLLLITPLALFFGSQYAKALKQEEKIKILTQEENLLEGKINEGKKDVLFWVNLELRKGLISILDETSSLLANIGRLTVNQKERLTKIRESAQKLLKSSQALKTEIDDLTKEE